MDVLVRKEVYRKIQRFPNKVQENIFRAIELLQDFPTVRLDVKKMKGSSGSSNVFRLRVGKYRLLYIVAGDKIVVFDVDVRGRIY